MSNQTSQGVLLPRTVDYMSVICHHDGHLLHHFDSCLLQAARRRWKDGGTVMQRKEGLLGCVSLWKWMRRLSAFKSPAGAEPLPLRRRSSSRVGSERAEQHTCLFLSVMLEVCDKGGWVSRFFLSSKARTVCSRLAFIRFPPGLWGSHTVWIILSVFLFPAAVKN